MDQFSVIHQSEFMILWSTFNNLNPGHSLQPSLNTRNGNKYSQCPRDEGGYGGTKAWTWLKLFLRTILFFSTLHNDDGDGDKPLTS
ncbi:hypothetical protein DMENIID0001_065210 [Sergentomyia squamirostris]